MVTVSAYKTHTGMVSKHNEDFVWVDESSGVFIVADGMGGHESGEVASRLAATTVGETILAALQAKENTRDIDFKDLLIGAIEKANKTVWTASGAASQKRRMGATIVVSVIVPPVAYIAHAGDARVYLINNATMTRLTQDDSWVAHLVASGVLSEEDVKHNKLSHIITKAIGQGSPVDPTFSEVSISAGDWLLLCSDGLWNMVEDTQILEQLQQINDDPQQLVESLTLAANNAGGKDNISIIAVKVV